MASMTVTMQMHRTAPSRDFPDGGYYYKVTVRCPNEVVTYTTGLYGAASRAYDEAVNIQNTAVCL